MILKLKRNPIEPTNGTDELLGYEKMEIDLDSAKIDFVVSSNLNYPPQIHCFFECVIQSKGKTRLDRNHIEDINEDLKNGWLVQNA